MLPPRSVRTALAGALIGLTSLSIAACGGSDNPRSSAGGNPEISVAKLTSDAYKHSDCMRSHGVANFPDPHTFEQNGQSGVSINLTPSITQSPAFQSAQKTCAHLMPGGGATGNSGRSAAQQRAQTEALLAFSACMRKHGFPRFPDPSSQGQLSPSAIQSAGINLQAPAVKPAALACTTVTHGDVTKADVERAIAHPGASGNRESSAPGPGG